jgi:hypothetical protein
MPSALPCSVVSRTCAFRSRSGSSGYRHRGYPSRRRPVSAVGCASPGVVIGGAGWRLPRPRRRAERDAVERRDQASIPATAATDARVRARPPASGAAANGEPSADRLCCACRSASPRARSVTWCTKLRHVDQLRHRRGLDVGQHHRVLDAVVGQQVVADRVGLPLGSARTPMRRRSAVASVRDRPRPGTVLSCFRGPLRSRRASPVRDRTGARRGPGPVEESGLPRANR